MANYQEGETIFVPASLLGIANPSFAVVERTVLGNINRSVCVDAEGGVTTEVASSRVFPRIGVLLLRIGDYGSEHQLLDPLYKSLLQYFRLLVGPEVVGFEIRTVEEFTHIWGQEHATKRYLVIVGTAARCHCFWIRRLD